MKCPNCQNEIPANSKFCTYCGYQIPQVAATGAQPQSSQPQFGPTSGQSRQFNNGQTNFTQGAGQQQGFNQSAQTDPHEININVNLDQTSAYAKNYWGYLMHGVKRPSDFEAPFHKYFGLVSLLLSSFIVALTVTMMEVHSVGGIFSAYDNYANTHISSSAGFKTFFGVFIISIISAFFTYSMTFLVTRGFLGDRSADYMEGMTRYYHISSIGLLVAGVGAILSIFGAFAIPLAFVALIFFSIMTSISFVAMIFMAKATNQFDKVYAYLIGAVLLAIIGFLLYLMIVSMVGFGAVSSLHDLIP